MVASNSIFHLNRKDVDEDRWEESIALASNASPFARVEYLDALCPEWEALIMNDYEFVMPLPVKKKLGIRYLYQPFMVPHLGVFGKQMDPAIVNTFINHIPKNIRWIDITLNPKSLPSPCEYSIQLRSSYILDLSRNYEEIKTQYRSNHLRNIQRAQKAGCLIDLKVDPTEIFNLAETYLKPRGHFPSQHERSFLQLSKKWIEEGSACTYGIRLGDQLLSAALFIIYQNRAYYLLVGNHPNGKTIGASHALIDSFIREQAGKNLVLDFEGSDVPSLAFFYEGYGAQLERYGWLQIDRLPKWISWIQKFR